MDKDREPLILNESDPELGGKITDDFAYKNNVANASIRVRLGFIRKVYCLLSFQLALTFILGSVALFVPTVQFYIANNDWLVFVALSGNMVLLFALFTFRKKHPHNLILLTGFTVLESYTIGVIISRFDSVTVLQAVLITFIIVLALTFYTFQTKRDFTTMGAGLFAGLIVLIFGGMLNIFVNGSAFDFIFASAGALLFSLFIIYDTQLLMHKLSCEEYILATINLYIDIINLFLYILRILAEAKRQ